MVFDRKFESYYKKFSIQYDVSIVIFNRWSGIHLQDWSQK